MTVTDRFTGELPRYTAAEAASLLPERAVVATSGFGSVGYPKAVPEAIAAADESYELTILTGGSVGEAIDTRLVDSGDMTRRFPYIGTATARKAANDGAVAFHDRHVAHVGDEIQYGGRADVDVAIIEAVAVGENWLIPSPSLGQTPAFVDAADSLIVEVNHHQPLALQYIHDIYRPGPPPDRTPLPLTAADERIGDARIEFSAKNLTAVVETNRPDSTYDFRKPTPVDQAIAANVGEWLAREADRNPAFQDALHLQVGVGALGNALMAAIGEQAIPQEVVYFGEVIQDGLLDRLDDGTVQSASATTLALTDAGQEQFYAAVDDYADQVVLRPVDVTNAAELIERFGVIAINSALEVDLYSHVNSTHINGTHVVNGLGGSGDYNRSGLITVIALASTTPDDSISRIVPMVPHVDHTEHDIDVIITDHGIADLRGLAPRERAEEILDVAHPEYRPELSGYLDRADTYGGHVPHDLETALNWPTTRQHHDE